MRETLHVVQEKTDLNRAVVLLIKLKHLAVAQLLGYFGNSNSKDETVDRAQARQSKTCKVITRLPSLATGRVVRCK